MTMRRALFAAAPLNTDLIIHRGIPPLPGFGWDGRPAWPLLATQPAGDGGAGGGGAAGQGGGQGAGTGGQGAGTGGASDGTARDFTAPKDQAEFDRMVSDRLRREREKFGDYDDLKRKAGEYDKTVEAQKSETQKLNDRAAAAEKTASEHQLRALRAEVALDKKLTPSQAKRLVGSTKEELEADAEDLLKDLGASAGSQGGSGTGGQSTSFDSGARDTAQTPKGDAGLAEAKKRFPEKYASKT
jgi:hypothetical protein